jgi:predicted regulator of Ras-like GTPase activity (Roadblock/LC7/MglB family)
MPKPTRQLSDAELRERRLVFYKEDIQTIDSALRDFLARSKSKAALLVDKDGHLITQEGNTEGADTDTVSALVAGCFAATREMARILGEEEFTALFHQGRHDNLQLSLVGHRTILAVLFDDTTTIGMVRLYSAETARKLGSLFKKIATRDPGNEQRGADEQLSDGFQAAAANTLDSMFGGN